MFKISPIFINTIQVNLYCLFGSEGTTCNKILYLLYMTLLYFTNSETCQRPYLQTAFTCDIGKDCAQNEMTFVSLSNAYK